MLYKCEICDYTTKRLLNFQRHENRKIPCSEKSAVQIVSKKMTESIDRSEYDTQSLHEDSEPKEGNLDGETYPCTKCLKVFSRYDNRKRHEKECDGFHALQCKICLKMFATKQGKLQHVKYVKCKPYNHPIQTINNVNIVNNTTNNTINNTTNNNINIRVNFGNESLKLLCQSDGYSKLMDEHVKLGKYAISRSIEKIYFNDEFPENQTLKKERRNDKLVSIQCNGRWETRLFDDICKDIVKKTEEYHDNYFKDLQNKYSRNDRNKEFKKIMIPLRQFAHQMLWYGWTCNEIQSLGMSLNEPSDDEELKRRQKKMKNIMIEQIYNKTCDNISMIVQ